MNRRQKPPRPFVRSSAYRQAFDRLDEALEQNSGFSNAERIQRLGRQMFGDLWDEPEQAKTVAIPK